MDGVSKQTTRICGVTPAKAGVQNIGNHAWIPPQAKPVYPELAQASVGGDDSC
jgi:hypothetical protein